MMLTTPRESSQWASFHASVGIGWLIALLAASTAVAQDVNGTADAPTDETRRVYVPFDQLDVVLDRDRQGVMLPRQEFEELYEKARANRAVRPRLPRGVVLSGVEYDARISGEQLLVTATVEFTQFADSWQILALPLKGMAVERATLNGQPARMGRSLENGRALHLLNDRPGAGTLKLELSTPLSSVGSDRVATLGLVPATAASLQVTLPAGKHLLVDGLSVERPAEIAEQAAYDVAVGGKDKVVLRVTDRRTERAADAFVLASTRYGVAVAPGSVAWRAETTLNVFGQTIDRLVCTVPRSLEITDVESNGLEAWELADGDDAATTEIALKYRQPFDGLREVVLTGVMTTPAGAAWTVPNLHVEGVASHVGRVAVAYPRGTRLRLNGQSGVRRVADANRGTKIRPVGATANSAQAVGTLLFDVWQEQFTIEFVTQTKRREVAADIFTQLAVSDTGLQANVLQQVRTLYAPLFDWDVLLPDAWTVTTATSEGRPLPWRVVAGADGEQRVRVSFPTPLPPGEALRLLIEARLDPAGWPVGTEGTEIDLPEVRLPDAAVVEGTLLIAASDDFEVVPLELRGLDPEHLPNATGRLGYRYQDTRFSGRLRVAQRPSRLSVETLTFTRLDPQALRSHLSAEIEVEGGGLRTLDAALPESTGTDVRFRTLPTRGEAGQLVPPPANIIEQQPAAPVNGERLWTLKFDRRVKGRLAISVDVETPRADEEQEPGFFAPHVLRLPQAERQHGVIALEAAPEQRLEIEAVGVDGRPLEEVDPADLMLPPDYRPRERIVAVYSYTLPGFRVANQEQRFDRVPVPTAVCRQSHLTSILGATGDFQHHGRYQITAVGVQSIGVRLPEGASLWSTLIDAKPIEVRRDGGLYLVPLPTGPGADEVQTLELFYKTRHDPLERSGRIQQQPPRLSAVIGGTQQPLEILQQQWEVSHPRATMLTRSNGRFQPEGELDRSSLLSRIQQSFSIGSTAEMGRNLLAVAIAAAVIAVLTLGYRKLGYVGLGVGAAILLVVGAAFLLPTIQSSRFADNAKFGDVGFNVNAPRSGSQAVFERGDGAAGETDVDGVMAETAPATPRAPKGPIQRDHRIPQSEVDAPVAEPEAPPGIDVAGSELPSAANDSSIENRMRSGDDVDEITDAFSARENEADSQERDIDIKVVGGITGMFTPSDGGALLSVAVEMQPPDNHRQTTFTYLGNGDDGAAAALDVGYENGRDGAVFRLFLGAAMLCLFWFARQRSPRTKALLGALGLTVPLALIAVTPVSWHLVLDGVFFGALAGVLLWLAVNRARAWSSNFRDILAARPTARTTAGLIVLIASLVAAQSLFAQNQRASNAQPQASGGRKPPVASDVSVASNPAVSNTTIVSDEGTSPGVRKQQGADAPRSPETIVIPYNPDGDPLSGGRVFLPQAKFRELWNDAYPDKREKTPAPLEGMVAGAIYSAKLAPERNGSTGRIAVTARFVLYSFREHQITLPLPLGEVAVRSAKLDGQPAALMTNGHAAEPDNANGAQKQQAEPGPAFSIVLTGAGLHLLDVAFDLPAQLTGPAGTFTVPLLPVASGRFTFAPPRDKLTLRVNGGSGTFRRRSEGETESIEVPVDAGGALKLSWQPAAQRGGIENIVHSDAAAAVLFDDAGLKMTSSHRLRVRQGSLNEVSFTLPADLKLKTIGGPDVGGWGIADEENQRVLRVFLRRAIDTETRITCELFRPLSIDGDAAALPLPAFAPRGVTREIGMVGVFSPPQLLVRGEAAAGVVQINASQFAAPAELKVPAAPGLAYRYTARPFELNLSVARRRPETRAAADHRVFVGRRRVNVTTIIDFRLAETPRSRLTVRLPQGYLPLQVAADGLADWYLNERDDPTRDLIVELDAPRTGELSLTLAGAVQKEPDDASTTIALPRPLDVNRLESGAAVRVDESYRPLPGELGHWKAVRPDRLSARLRRGQAGPVRFAFLSSHVEPGAIELELQQAQAELEASAVTTITVGDAGVGYRLELLWTIKRAASDRFAFTAPDWLAGKLDVRAPGLRRVIETDLEGPRTRWEIQLQDPVRERYYLLADAMLPPPAGEKLETPVPVAVEHRGGAARFTPVETQQQFVLLVNLSRNQVSAASRDNLDEVTAADLPIKLADAALAERASELARLRRAEPAPLWSITRFEHERGAAAIVNLATLLTVVERDGSYRTQATYSVRNRTRQFLPLEMPEGVKLLSVFVKGRPSRTVQAARNGGLLHLVPLASTSRADPSFDVKLVYSGRLKNGPLPSGVRLGQSIDLPAPRVTSVKEDAKLGVPVGRTTWTVYLPKEYHAAPLDELERNNFTLSTPDRIGLYEQMVRLKDYVDLSKVLVSSPSNLSRYQAANNLKQLDSKLHRDGKNSELHGKSDSETRLFEELRKEALEQQRLNRDRIQIDGAGRNGILLDDSDSMALDEKAQQKQFRTQSESQFLSNSVGIVVGDEPANRGAKVLGGKPGEGKPGVGKPGDVKGKYDRFLSRYRRSFADQQQELSEQQSLNAIEPIPEKMIPRPGKKPAAPNASDGRTLGPRQGVGGIGGGGMGGGGMGGGIDTLGTEYDASAALAPAEEQWTQAGGLSLDIDVPTDGQQLSFSKVSGDPRLAISVRPRETAEAGLGLVWTLLWLAVGIGLAALLSRSGAGSAIRHELPKVLAAAGLVAFFLIPAAAWPGFALFVIGAICLAWQHRQPVAS